MRIPLLLEADPRESFTGPRVMLPKGTWRFTVASHIVDAEIAIGIYDNDIDVATHYAVHEAEARGPVQVQASVVAPSDEKRLTVFAELIK